MIRLSTNCCECCALRFKDTNTDEYAQQDAFSSTSVFINNFTVEAWVNPQPALAVPGFFLPVVNLTQWGSSVENFWALDLEEIGGQLKVRFTVSTGVDIVADCDLQYGTWYHIVANRIGIASNDWEIYVNGIKQPVYSQNGQFNVAMKFIGIPSALFKITYGNFNDGTTNMFYRGAIAQVRIYNQPLTGMEAQYNYRHGFYEATNQQNLVLWAPFNSCEGIYTTSLIQSATPQNTITLHNFAGRTALGGGAWISDCPCLSTCEINSEVDPLYFRKTDELYYPVPPFSNKLLSDFQFCDNCVPDLDAGTISRIDTDEVTFSWGLNQVGLTAEFRMEFICADSSIFVIHKKRADYTDAFDFWGGIIDAINTEPGLGMYCKIVNGQFIVTASSGNTDCLCQSSFITRSVATVDELEYSPPQNKRLFSIACGETFTLPFTSFMIISVFDMCITKLDEIKCIEGSRLKIYIPQLSSISNDCSWSMCVPEKNVTQANFCTQPVIVNENCNTLLIRFRNENEPYYVMRFAATLSEQNYRKKQEISTSSRGVTRKLLSIVDKTYILRTDYLTRYTHDWIIKACESDIFEIELDGEWKRLTAEETYKIEYEEVPVPQKGMGTITLISYNYEYYNNFC